MRRPSSNSKLALCSAVASLGLCHIFAFASTLQQKRRQLAKRYGQ